MSGAAVLVLTGTDDPHADDVILKLNDRGVPVVRFDTGEFPEECRLFSQIADGEPGWVGGILRKNGPSVDLKQIRSVWYRRPQTFRLDAALAGEAEEFARAECRYGIGGVLRGLDCPWVNHPDHLTTAQYKPFQLAVALRHGLRIPETVVTNDPDSAAAFCASAPTGVIYKVLSAGMVERVPGRGVGSIFTTEITPAMLETRMREITVAPCMFQHRIPVLHHLRVTVVGTTVHVAGIEAPAGVLDWRLHYGDLRYFVTSLPPDVEAATLAMMRTLELRFGAFDFIVTPEGAVVFLEVNPSGQWLWLDRAAGLAISDALADLLANAE
jgi:ATP-grasp ribosomal peptide maturase